MSDAIDAPKVPDALPNVVVIGAMKCATTALHRYLHAHPQISMTGWKETNFFIGGGSPPHADAEAWWRSGQWHRGLEWYSSLFDPAVNVRGETSPGYTSPSYPYVAARMAAVLPDARLIYLVRDPVDRAVSQYRHHVRDGAERRPMAEAILDPASQYVERSRYFERLRPFVRHFPAGQILVVVQERLLAGRVAALRRVFGHVGADESWWDTDLHRRWHVGEGSGHSAGRLRSAVMERVADDVRNLKGFLQDDIPEWDTVG